MKDQSLPSLKMTTQQAIAACKRIMNQNHSIMKLMCVKSQIAWPLIAALTGGSYPEVGDEVTGKSTRRCACGKHDVYELEEHWLTTGFPTNCFAIMPDADADEIEDAEKEGLVPSPISCL